MTDDSNCHCPPCTAMNEPLTLEGDIRYLKAHIESKDRQLADAMLRIEIYREAWRDAAAESNKLREENERLKNDRASLVEEANELYGKLGRIATIVDEITK